MRAVRINLNEAGHFSSVAQAREYQSAMQMKQMIESAAAAVIPFDDAVNIDYNSPGKGDILVDNLVIRTKPGEYAYEGRVIYGKDAHDNNDITGADLKMTTVCSPLKEKIAVVISKDQNIESYERTGESEWACSTDGYNFSFHDRIVIDRKAGYIDYQSSHSDVKKPQQ
jgi:hypothetical protein